VATGHVLDTISRLKSYPQVRYAEPNYIVHADVTPNDPSYAQLWAMKNTGQLVSGTTGTPGADIKAEPAWNVTTGSNSIVVGVIDTGIDYNHPDLAANVWSNPGGIGGCGVGTHGKNFITGVCNPMDDHNHGTHVSGTIGAVGNNGVGVVGVNWTTSIMGLKFLDASGSGSTLDAIKAIDFAVAAKQAGVNLRVLSNSWGGGGFEQALLDAINKAGANGILFVAAAGNNQANNDVTPHFPSSYGAAPYNAANVIAVAATDQDDAKADFSNYGANSVHLGAPGVNILSTTRSNTYSYFAGTSMATPHVSGAAALVLSKAGNGAMTVAQVKAAILNNVDAVPSMAGITRTGGRLNLYKAVTGGAPPPPPTPDFSISASPPSQSVVRGNPTSYSVSLTRTNFPDSVTFGLSSPPAGVSGTFSPAATTGTSSTLNITTASSTTPATYTLTITGTGGSPPLNRQTTVSLTVTAPTPPPTPNFALSASPSSQTVVRGSPTSYSISLTRTNFPDSVSFSLSGQPTGVSGLFSPAATTGTSSTLNITTASTTTPGTYTLTITGTGGSPTTLNRQTTVTLVVNSSTPPPPPPPCDQGTCDNGNGGFGNLGASGHGVNAY
jgi:subtilisin family serine protease